MSLYFIFLIVFLLLAGIFFFLFSAKSELSRRVQETDSGVKALAEKLSLIERLPLIEQKLEANKETFSTSIRDLKDTTKQIIPVVSRLSENLGKISSEWNAWEKAIQKVTSIFSDTVKKGTVGEFLLENILSASLPHHLWARQYNIDGKRVDAVVFLKGKELVLPIDSKFPLDLARAFLTAPEGEKRKAWRALVKEVERESKDVSEKYVRPERGTTNFAAIFVPTEDIHSLLSSPLDPFGERNDLLFRLQKNRVVLVGPSSIYSFISLAIAGYQAYSMGKRIEEFLSTVQSIASTLENINKLGLLIEKKAREISGNAEKILTHTSKGLGRLKSVSTIKEEPLAESAFEALPHTERGEHPGSTPSSFLDEKGNPSSLFGDDDEDLPI